MTQLDSEYDIRRQQVWLAAWVETASASNCTRKSSPTEWADECLKCFDERFNPVQPSKEKQK